MSHVIAIRQLVVVLMFMVKMLSRLLFLSFRDEMPRGNAQHQQSSCYTVHVLLLKYDLCIVFYVRNVSYCRDLTIA